MACYHPLRGYRSKYTNPSGKRSIVFSPRDGLIDLPVELPCGQCIGCRLEKSRQWAIRAVHEAQLYENNCFLTLTFNESCLGHQTTLVKSDFQNFLKRFRKHTSPRRIRYFHCGEYGEKFARPHHHSLIFNYDFPDKQLHSKRNDITLYTSAILNKLWPHGYSTIGELNFETAAYVARYTLKKKTGEQSDEFYDGRLPPYNSMSLKPGIGESWLKKFTPDVYPRDEVLIRSGLRCKPPKYYDQLYDRQNPESMKRIKHQRYAAQRENAENNTEQRLETREALAYIRTKELNRTYEQ